ncbi:cytochrome P450 [Gonapodya prolifera JEL478]|uniref:Cytochrome P450 n=1 Tax=Gonapodya prolifera (strain JEL478) TaxID=1344416 RepID=A0A139B1C9_GONPJ|nr:cytochrome P450 [Gonapodya prolifera JEL478]|eukprot:KXS22535.1 cytochrome P450 [Gonapodya prolifera JEL478]
MGYLNLVWGQSPHAVRTAEINPNDVTYATLSKLKLLDWVCKETLRLYVPYAISPRQNIKEDTVCGYKLPLGTHFEVMQMLPQRSPLYWPNPEKFDPDRWDGLVPERFCYFPWGVGE